MPGSPKGKKKPVVEEKTVPKGVFMFANGDKYEGEYAKQPDGTSERSGSGKHCTTDGITYDGQWAGDCMNGKGKMLFPSGAVYEGDFVNNRFHGQGKYQWPNGSFYIGQFFENKMQGEGEFTDTEGQTWTGKFIFRAAPGLKFKLCM